MTFFLPILLFLVLKHILLYIYYYKRQHLITMNAELNVYHMEYITLDFLALNVRLMQTVKLSLILSAEKEKAD